MAVIAVTPVGTGYTPAAASGGGDTVVSGTVAGGWGLSTVLVATVGATPTTITIDGVAQSAITSQTAVYRLGGGVYKGRALTVTYSSVTGLTVGAVDLGL
jgi:hypothetical protein